MHNIIIQLIKFQHSAFYTMVIMLCVNIDNTLLSQLQLQF